MTWTTFFLFFRLLAVAMVDGFKYSQRWRLIDLWNNTYIVGNALLGMSHDTLRPCDPTLSFGSSPGSRRLILHMPDLFESADSRSGDRALIERQALHQHRLNSK